MSQGHCILHHAGTREVSPELQHLPALTAPTDTFPGLTLPRAGQGNGQTPEAAIALGWVH